MSEIDFFHNTDGEEEIKLCLSCEREDCINCLALKKELRDRPYRGGRVHSVDQYALDGTFIKTWRTLAEAARAYSVPAKTISRSCKMGNYPVKGYIWKNHEEANSEHV